jgi:hypothetical protein
MPPGESVMRIVNPIISYLDSSNLTMAGLSWQGELNVDVLDHDACQKLAKWFNDHWNDKWCIDISDELVQIIGESWAREPLVPPYHIYVKMAYHLSPTPAKNTGVGGPPPKGSKLPPLPPASMVTKGFPDASVGPVIVRLPLIINNDGCVESIRMV